MKKISAILAALVMIGFGFAAANTFAEGQGDGSAKSPGQSYFEKSYNVNQLLGMKVNDQQGENLGKIEDFVADSHGRIAFAILSYGGIMGMGKKIVAVPFDALAYNPPGRLFVLDMTKEKLASAPEYQKRSDLVNPKLAEDIYKFFGLHPYWTEESMETSKPEE